ncbi:MAG: bifunctional hydroxymethylpyrimidine kinase/phosphomethylpyrimidine kinase [Candidatus Odinarchaeia archaeon]
MIPIALTIAGTDPSGGAGISADILTFSSLNTYGVFAITAITIQNTKEVQEVEPVRADLLEKQISIIFKSFDISAAKTGLICNPEQIDVIKKFFSDKKTPLVVDPVFKSSSGLTFSDPKTIYKLEKELLPLTTLITPNISEASIISGGNIKSLKDMIEASHKILNKKVKAVLIKGGSFKNKTKILDVLNAEGKIKVFEKNRVRRVDAHGSGCVLSSAITAFLAQNYSVTESVMRAEEYIDNVYRYPVKFDGLGYILKPNLILHNSEEKIKILNEVYTAVKPLIKLQLISKPLFDKESKIAYSIKKPLGEQDVLVIQLNSLIEVEKEIIFPAFGIRSITSQLIMLLTKQNTAIRTAVDIPYNQELLEVFNSMNMKSMGEIDFREEKSKFNGEVLNLKNTVREQSPDYSIVKVEGNKKRIIIFSGSIFELISKLLDILTFYKNKNGKE